MHQVIVPETEEKNNMPMVNGKKFPYTKEGMAAAKKAAKSGSKKMVKESPAIKAKMKKMGKTNGY